MVLDICSDMRGTVLRLQAILRLVSEQQPCMHAFRIAKYVYITVIKYCECSLCREQALAVNDEPSSTLGTAVNAPTPDEDIYVAVEFSLALPPGFRETEVLPPKPVETRPGFGSFGV